MDTVHAENEENDDIDEDQSSDITEDVDSNGGEDIDSNGGEDESEDVDTEDESEKYSVWTYLRKIAITNDKVDEKYCETIEALVKNGMDEEEAQRDALRVVLPNVREIIYERYTKMLLLWHHADENESHEKVLSTKRKLMDDEDYDAEEAIRYAVKKRRYLIQKETQTLDEDFERAETQTLDTDQKEDSDSDE